MLTIDCLVHPFQANTPQRPWANPHDDGRPHVTADEMVMAMDAVGVDGAIAVSPRGMYRFDPGYAIEVQRAYPDRFAIVRPCDPENPAVGETIVEWKRVPGAVAVRLMLGKHLGLDTGMAGTDLIAKEAARQGLPVNFQCGGNLDAAMALIDRHPETRFVLDHLALYQPRKAPAPSDVWADLPKILELAKRPNAVIKVSGACTMSTQAFPYDDIWDNLLRIFDAWASTAAVGHRLDAHLPALSLPQRRGAVPTDPAPERKRQGQADGRNLRPRVRLAAKEPLCPAAPQGAG